MKDIVQRWFSVEERSRAALRLTLHLYSDPSLNTLFLHPPVVMQRTEMRDVGV